MEDAALIHIFLHGVSVPRPGSAGKRSTCKPSAPESVL
jgi:hypothetical protein